MIFMLFVKVVYDILVFNLNFNLKPYIRAVMKRQSDLVSLWFIAILHIIITISVRKYGISNPLIRGGLALAENAQLNVVKCVRKVQH